MNEWMNEWSQGFVSVNVYLQWIYDMIWYVAVYVNKILCYSRNWLNINEWINEQMNDQMNEWMNEWMITRATIISVQFLLYVFYFIIIWREWKMQLFRKIHSFESTQ